MTRIQNILMKHSALVEKCQPILEVLCVFWFWIQYFSRIWRTNLIEPRGRFECRCRPSPTGSCGESRGPDTADDPSNAALCMRRRRGWAGPARPELSAPYRGGTPSPWVQDEMPFCLMGFLQLDILILLLALFAKIDRKNSWSQTWHLGAPTNNVSKIFGIFDDSQVAENLAEEVTLSSASSTSVFSLLTFLIGGNTMILTLALPPAMANIFGDPFFPLFSNGASSGNNLSFFFRAIAPAEATPAPVKSPGSPVSMVRMGLGPIGRGLGIEGLGMGMIGFSVEPGLKSRSPVDYHYKALLLTKAIFRHLCQTMPYHITRQSTT